MSKRHFRIVGAEFLVRCVKTYLKKAIICALVLLGITVVSAISSWAQGHGSISGTITDSSSAVVPGVNVTLTQLATRVERSFVTAFDGFYSFPDIAPGNYSVKVSAMGFQTAETEVSVRVNQLVRADLQLVVGITTETVNVTAEASQINLEDA